MPFPDEQTAATVVAYRSAWAGEFATMRDRLAELLAGLAVGVDHVGSTSVPGLAAKDVIDVQLRAVPGDVGEITRRLVAAGFRRRPEPWNTVETSAGHTATKVVFAPAVGDRPVNMHVRAAGGPNARQALLFRDYLRHNTAARDVWGRFKTTLSEQVPDLSAYGQVKNPATDILMGAAEAWAATAGWRAPDERLDGAAAWVSGASPADALRRSSRHGHLLHRVTPRPSQLPTAPPAPAPPSSAPPPGRRCSSPTAP